VTATQVGGGIASPAARDPGPLVTFVLKRTVAKVHSIELDVYVIDAAALVVSRECCDDRLDLRAGDPSAW
jgi:hypothetical protein